MKKLYIKSSKITPEVIFKENGEFKIEGRSIPEDPESFYTPVMNWMNEYFETPKENTKLDIQLEYINSGSSKFILALLRMFKDCYDKGTACSINWIYEEDDENLHELGVHYKSILNIPFNLVEII